MDKQLPFAARLLLQKPIFAGSILRKGNLFLDRLVLINIMAQMLWFSSAGALTNKLTEVRSKKAVSEVSPCLLRVFMFYFQGSGF